LLGEYDGTGTLIEETVWLGDIPVATLRPNGATVSIYYIHSDPLNTPRQVTRPGDHTPMWTWNSDPFGTDAANPNPAGAVTFTYNLRFPGQILDGAAGLHQNHFRDFDPAVGGYVESDRIGLRGGVNTYAYAEGNPVGNYDSKGLASSSLAETIGQIQAVGLGNAWQASNDATDAAQAAVDAVNNNEIWGGIEGLHNGPADAFRHCTWSCLMTRSIGIIIVTPKRSARLMSFITFATT
jgi:RHS repeat-associated protein